MYFKQSYSAGLAILADCEALHRIDRIKQKRIRLGVYASVWCGRQDLNLHELTQDPKSCASANSATPAYINAKCKVQNAKLFLFYVPPRYDLKHKSPCSVRRNSPCFCAFSRSLYHPQGALALKAANPPKERRAFFACAKHKYARIYKCKMQNAKCKMLNYFYFTYPPRYGLKHKSPCSVRRNSPCFCAFSRSLYHPQGALALKAANPPKERRAFFACAKHKYARIYKCKMLNYKRSALLY